VLTHLYRHKQQYQCLSSWHDSETTPIEPFNTNLPFLQERPLTPPTEIEQEVHFHPVVAVVGVGYVGSYLVKAFAKVYEVVAFDISQRRAEQIAQQFQGRAVRSTSHAPNVAVADAFLISVPTMLNSRKPAPRHITTPRLQFPKYNRCCWSLYERRLRL
jgi:threonine dehydrogenase-like Zn-dependent dehydrogenase